MKVQLDVKSLDISLGNTGVVLYIADNAGKHVGKLRVGQATLEWCKGKVPLGKGKKVPLEEFVEKYLKVLP